MMSTPHRHGRPVLVCAILAVAMATASLVGCDPAEPTPPPSTASASRPAPSGSSSSATPTPTPTPSPTSQRAKDEAAIKQAILDYYETNNRVSMDSTADIKALTKVAAGELLEADLGVLKSWRAKGWRSTKPVMVENLHVQSIEGTGERATATYCANSTGVDVVDPEGKSHVVKGRPDKFPSIMTVEKRDGAWLPVRERDGGNACAK